MGLIMRLPHALYLKETTASLHWLLLCAMWWTLAIQSHRQMELTRKDVFRARTWFIILEAYTPIAIRLNYWQMNKLWFWCIWGYIRLKSLSVQLMIGCITLFVRLSQLTNALHNVMLICILSVIYSKSLTRWELITPGAWTANRAF